MSDSDAIHPNPDLQERLSRIYDLHREAIDMRLGCTPYDTILHDLGDPHLHLPPVVHVAGTNGKGSTIAMLKSLLLNANKTVHVMTSPHLSVFNERITLANDRIDDDTLLKALDHVWAVTQGRPVTFFEFTSALTFYVFAQCEADFVLLETGLGGRLDCSNVVPDPIAVGITAIGYDHQEFLGDSLAEIAGEKAGIMKAGVKTVLGFQPYFDEVYSVFYNKAAALQAPLSVAGKDWDLTDVPQPNLHGVHQHWNAAMAVQLYKAIDGLPAINLRALNHVEWPARMERLVGFGHDVWFDAAHNEGGAHALSALLKGWRTNDPDQPIHLVMGLGSNKDPDTLLRPLLPYVDTVSCLSLDAGRHPQSAQSLCEQITLTQAQCIDVCDIQHKQGRVIICGSLYLYASLFAKN